MKKVNYLYFGIYFLLLSLMSASGIFTKSALEGSRLFFLLYAMGQAALETCALALIGYLLERVTNRKVFLAYIGAIFFLFILHVLDFIMERILDLSVWGTLGFVLDESFSNFLLLLDASGIPISLWVVMFGSLLLIPFLGIALYKGTEKIIERHDYPPLFESLPITLFCTLAALLCWDFSASRIIHPNTYTAFTQTLPWKFTFLRPETVTLNTPGFLQKIPDEETILKELQAPQKPLSKKPNIYLFVIESFRDDFITQSVAPNLFAFKKLCAEIAQPFSNANGTHLSWYSLFHSQFSHNWHLVQQNNWQSGSPPLHLLKNLGYKTNLYSSADLGYYGMESLLFGKDQFLLDTSQKFHSTTASPAETDAEALNAMLSAINKNPDLHQGQLFVTFWDSTHFNYSWPKNWAPKFTPFANDLSYFRAFYSESRINKIKNRYRNSVHYIDSLFGKFLENIPNKEDAIIIVTGDHGEEFFEKGHLFHCSHIVQEQTKVPLLMYFGGKTPERKRGMVSHMDIFPSILDHLSGEKYPSLMGESIFREKTRPFVAISRFNAGRTPYEFCIHNGRYKLVGQFLDRKNIPFSDKIKIVSLSTFDDQTFPESHRGNIHEWIANEFGAALH